MIIARHLSWFAIAAVLLCWSVPVQADNPSDPASKAYTGRKGTTFYVSKLGDDSDGLSWKSAFHSIQKALTAVPDREGGHRIIVRPDTYRENNLYTSNRGAKGSYNALIGDFDGSYGSGATGWVVVDSSDPEGKGLKSFDWFGCFRAYVHKYSKAHDEETFSPTEWDRWTLHDLYTTGAEGGTCWDQVEAGGEPFTVIVDHCVGIGRAFGGGVFYPSAREGEPSLFKDSYFLCLDWWGDAGALAVGGKCDSMPDSPQLIVDNCTMVGPDNALQVVYPSKFFKMTMKNCRFIVLNFSQPHGRPSTGIISLSESAGVKGSRLHIDFENCKMMGYKVFGEKDEPKGITYTVKGKVEAYVQYQQGMPKGFTRLSEWPVDLFQHVSPPPIEKK